LIQHYFWAEVGFQLPSGTSLVVPWLGGGCSLRCLRCPPLGGRGLLLLACAESPDCPLGLPSHPGGEGKGHLTPLDRRGGPGPPHDVTEKWTVKMISSMAVHSGVRNCLPEVAEDCWRSHGKLVTSWFSAFMPSVPRPVVIA
jgi:hypothetical protein